MSNQIIITSGAKVRSLEGVLTGTSGVVSSVPLGAANGVATLDSGGKVPVSQLPSSVVTYLGTWNAATNTPTLVNGVGDAGDMYICNVAGTVNFGAGPVTFAVGDWVLYGSGTWQKSNGQNGTVTSVGASITGNAIGLTGSPITTAGTLAFAFSGTSGQYVNGAGNLTTFPTLITSIGLSMPSAFSVANSPLTANGSINVTGAGTTSQYIDGTGALQTFPVLTGYVPYTGATSDVDLGTHVLNAQALHVKGTAGAGHLGLKHQTASPTGSANESLIFADVNGNLGWQNDNLYLTTLVSNANTANRSYTFPNASGTLALTSDISYPVTSVFGRTGAVTAQSGDYTTTLVTEGTRLYYTDARARAALSFTAGSGAYNSTTGVITIPTNTSQLTNGANFITLASLSAGAGISYNSTTGVITSTITQYTDAMARAAISGGTGISYNSTTGVITNTITQYTDALARAAISLTTTGTSGAATYNSTTGVLNIPQYTDAYTGTVTSVAITVPTGLSVSGSPITTSGTLAVTLTAGYSIPTTASQTNWDTAYTNRITSATSPLSITSNVISISQATTSTSGYLSSTDWNTFNSKQGTITLTTTGSSGAATFVGNTLNIPNYTLSGLGGIGGSGTANYLPKFTAGTTIGNSLVQDNGSTVSINRSPYYAIFVAKQTQSTYYQGITVEASSNDGQLQISHTGSLAVINSTYQSTAGYKPLAFYTSDLERMRLDTSGNLGLGVTPSAWGSILNVNQFGNYGAFIAGRSDSVNQVFIGVNAYYNGTSWLYSNNSTASRYYQDNGKHIWDTAPSGTAAGTAISFTQAMTLTASGNLLVGTTTDYSSKLVVIPSSNPTSSTGSNNQISIGETSNNTGYCLKVGYINTGGGYQGSIQSIAGGSGSTLFLNASGGNVLIGTTTDSGYKLDVNGTGRFSGSVTFAGGVYNYVGTNKFFAAASGSINYLYTGSSSLTILNQADSATLFTLANSGAATFSSSVTTQGSYYLDSSHVIHFDSGVTNNYYIGKSSSNLYFYTGGSFAFANGNVGIGTLSPVTPLHIVGGTATPSLSADGGIFTVHSSSSVQLQMGAIASSPYTFWLQTKQSTNSGASFPLALNPLGGNVLIGTTSDDGVNKLQVNGSIAATSTIAAVVPSNVDMFVFNNTGATYTKSCVVASMTATGGTGSYFFYGQQSTSTVALKIFSNGNIQNTNNSYGAISDARLKENITDATPKLDDLLKVKVRNYNLKGEKTKQLGVISQELEEIFPNMIEESTNLGENVKIKGVKYSVFVPMLIKAVQELKAEIETLKNK